MFGFIYILLSQKDNKTYVGSTTNLERRLLEHEKGSVRATKNRRPLKLVFSKRYDTIELARQYEHYLKTAAGRRQLAKLFSKMS